MTELRTLLRWSTGFIALAYLIIVVLGTLLAGAFRGRSEPPSPLAIVPGILLIMIWRSLGASDSPLLLHATAALAAVVAAAVAYGSRGEWDFTNVGGLAYLGVWLVWYVLTLRSGGR